MDEQLKQAFMQYLQLKSGALTQEEFEAYVQQLGEEGLRQEYTQFMQLMQQQLVLMRKFGGMLNYIQQLRGECPEGYEMSFFKLGGQICKKCTQKVKMEDGGQTPQNPVDAFKCGHKMKKAKVKKNQQGGDIMIEKAKGVRMPQRVLDIGNINRVDPLLGGQNYLRSPSLPTNIIGQPTTTFDPTTTQLPPIDGGTASRMNPTVKNQPIPINERVRKNQQGGEIWNAKSSGFLPRTTIFRTITPPKAYETGVPDTTYRKVVSYGLPFIDDVTTSGSVTHDRAGYYNTVDGNRTQAWEKKVGPSGRSTKGSYDRLKKEYDKMK